MFYAQAIMAAWNIAAVALMILGAGSETAVADPPPRQMNIFPFEYGTDEEWAKTTIFWFGEAEYPGQGRNYVDVRVAYSQSNFLVNVLVVDYYLWLDTNPQPADDLTQYDAIALYLDTQFDRAAAPQSDDFLFLVGQHNTTNYLPYMRDARGNGSTWNYGWNGADWRGPVGLDYSTGGPNNNDGNIDFGWTTRFVIPWSDLGLSGPPAEETQWGFGVRLYDRDDQPPAGGIPVQSWPETFQPNSPATWAALHYGDDAYIPRPGTHKDQRPSAHSRLRIIPCKTPGWVVVVCAPVVTKGVQKPIMAITQTCTRAAKSVQPISRALTKVSYVLT